MPEDEALVDQYLLNGHFQKAAELLDQLATRHTQNGHHDLAKECTSKSNILKGMDGPPEEYYKDDMRLSIFSFWDLIDDLVSKISTNFAGAKRLPRTSEIQDEEFLLVTKPRSMEDIQEENTRLVQMLQQYQERLQHLEVAQEENQLLRSSIIQFKQEFAKRKQQNLFQSIKLHQSKSGEEDRRLRDLEMKNRDLENELDALRTENRILMDENQRLRDMQSDK